MPPSGTRPDRGVDLILTGGRVLTMDPGAPAVEALAVSDGFVAAAGRADDVRGMAGSGTEVIDIGGLTAVPGFNDTHAHMDREGLKSRRPSLEGAASVSDVLDRIARLAAEASPGEWIVTMPVGAPPCYFGGPETLAEGRMPTRGELDAAAPDNPVCIAGVFGNWGEPPGYTALNSRALELNGIDRDTVPRVSGLEIERDEAGEPTGVIVEYNQRPFVEFDLLPAVPRFGLEERRDGIRRSMKAYNAVGTTSVYEGHGLGAQTIAAYRDLWEKGELTARVALTLSPAWRDVAEARTVMRDWLSHARGRGMGDPWFRITGVHIAYGGEGAVAIWPARTCRTRAGRASSNRRSRGTNSGTTASPQPNTTCGSTPSSATTWGTCFPRSWRWANAIPSESGDGSSSTSDARGGKIWKP